MSKDAYGIPGFRTKYFRVLWGDGAPCFYFGKDTESVYINFQPALHRGWQSYPKVFWNKSGWEYRTPVLFVGSQKSHKSKIITFPSLLIPAKLWRWWFYHKYPDMREDKPMKKENNDT